MKPILLLCAAASLAFTEARARFYIPNVCFCSDLLTEKHSKGNFVYKFSIWKLETGESVLGVFLNNRRMEYLHSSKHICKYINVFVSL